MTASTGKDASARRRARNRARGEARGYPRVRARPILRGARYKVTRRCLERRMFLAPDKDADELRNLFGYTLGLALEDNGQKLHASVVMSNHHHTDVTDTRGSLPDFKNRLHSTVARSVNAKRGRFDKLWSGDTPCDTRQPTDEETLGDLVYTLVNPVKAGLVKWGHRWPGFTTYGWKFGEVRTFKRPDWYFDPENPKSPKEVQVKLERPDIFPKLSDDELFDLLMVRVRERELESRRRCARRSAGFAASGRYGVSSGTALLRPERSGSLLLRRSRRRASGL